MHSKTTIRPGNRGIISILTLLLLFGSAIIGSFVLGFGSQEPTASPPDVALDFEADNETVTISHQGGDALPREEVQIRSPGEVGEWPGAEMTAGSEITVSELESGDTIEVVWNAPGGDQSVVIATYTVS